MYKTKNDLSETTRAEVIPILNSRLADKDTADIFTEISRGVDKYLWFVEAHLGWPGVATRRNQY